MTGTIQKMEFMMNILSKKKFTKLRKQKIWNLKFLKNQWVLKQGKTLLQKEEINNIQNGKKISWLAPVYTEYRELISKNKTKNKIELS